MSSGILCQRLVENNYSGRYLVPWTLQLENHHTMSLLLAWLKRWSFQMKTLNNTWTIQFHFAFMTSFVTQWLRNAIHILLAFIWQRRAATSYKVPTHILNEGNVFNYSRLRTNPKRNHNEWKLHFYSLALPNIIGTVNCSSCIFVQKYTSITRWTAAPCLCML